VGSNPTLSATLNVSGSFPKLFPEKSSKSPAAQYQQALSRTTSESRFHPPNRTVYKIEQSSTPETAMIAN
jgi:hypothetical protein